MTEEKEILTCANCGQRIRPFIWKNKPPLPCPKCGHNYPYSITYFDNKFTDNETKNKTSKEKWGEM